MWQRLFTIAFCAAFALRADVCRDLRTGPPAGSNYLDTPHPVAYRLSVKPAGPAFRITLRPLLLKRQTDSDNLVHAGDVEVAACEDGKQLQVLPVMAWQPIDFGATFAAHDINFDGYLDFSVLTEFAGKWGSKSYWVYDPPSGRFIENALTHALSENCLGTEWHGTCWKANSIDFDAGKREISAHYLIGVGDCGSPADRYRVEDNRLVVVHKEILTMDPDECTVSVWDRIGGSLRPTIVRRFDARGRPVK